MTYARLVSRWTGRAIIVGPFADDEEAHAFAPVLSQDVLESRLAPTTPEVDLDDRHVLEIAGALPMIDFDVEVL